MSVILKVSSNIVLNKPHNHDYSLDESAIGQINFEEMGEYPIEIVMSPLLKQSLAYWCGGTGYTVQILMRPPSELTPRHLTGDDIVYRVKD